MIKYKALKRLRQMDRTTGKFAGFVEPGEEYIPTKVTSGEIQLLIAMKAIEVIPVAKLSKKTAAPASEKPDGESADN